MLPPTQHATLAGMTRAAGLPDVPEADASAQPASVRYTDVSSYHTVRRTGPIDEWHVDLGKTITMEKLGILPAAGNGPIADHPGGA